MIHPPSNTRTKTQPKKREAGMRDEQVQQLLCLLNHYACLCLLLLLLLPAYLQIDRNFSQGDKTSPPPAALPVLHSHPYQCQVLLLTHDLTTQFSNMHPASSKCSSAMLHFLLSPPLPLATPDTKWRTVAITTILGKLRSSTGSPPEAF